MEVFIKASQFILSLSLLIALHELGHFIPAKLFKTKVEKFYLFFDYKFSIWKKKIGETVYGIGWIPLGGYVKIAGMIDESMDIEQMKQEPQPWEFRSKPAWQRLIIMLGGVTVNFILGWFIYVMMTFVWGAEYVKTDDIKHGFAVHESFEQYGFQQGDKILKINGEVPFDVTDINKNLFLRNVQTVEVMHANGTTEELHIPENIGSSMWEAGIMEPFTPRTIAVIDTIVPELEAAKAGLMKNDKILAVNGDSLTYWQEFTSMVQNSQGTIEVLVERDGMSQTLDVTPNENRRIGVSNYTLRGIEISHATFSFGESLSKGSEMAYWTLKDYITQFKYVFTKKGATSIGGFIAIGSIFPSTWSWQAFWGITAFLSIMLGFMNLLPIPALDGGHVVFTLYEMLTGRKPSDKFMEYAQLTGFLILIGLLILANGNDIVKLFS